MTLERHLLRQLWATFAATGLPLAPALPWPVLVAVAALYGLWYPSVFLGRLRLPRPLLWALTLGLAVLALGARGRMLDYGLGIQLLAAMLPLKLFETRTPRDLYVALFMGLFFVVAQLMAEPAPWAVAWLLLCALALLTLLVRLHDPAAGAWSHLGLTLRLAFQALPLTLVAFLLFPRLSAPLWQLGMGMRAAVSGLSAEMEPGGIGRLALSEEIAFRVRFEGQPPPPAERYWRVLVMADTDGRRWSAGPEPAPMPAGGGLLPEGPPLDYRVFLEPHRRTWLPVLDLPRQAPAGLRLTLDYQLRRPRPVLERLSYAVRSYPRYRATAITDGQRRLALLTPAGVSPRVRALAARVRGDGRDPGAAVARLLAWFRARPFVYTLAPPPLGGDPLDAFLFETRRGFCEHFATAFALVMRLAGVPTRVVTGYLGGELNPLGDYLIVRQSDAHAWVEVWLNDRGWVRVDPTASVAPERVERPPRPAPGGGEVLFAVDGGGALGRLGHRLALALDALRNQWNTWVLGYDSTRQRLFLRRLGLGFVDLWHLPLLLTLAGLPLLGGVAWWLVRAGRRPLPPEERLYRRFLARLARAGVRKAPAEGPRDFARRAARRLPGRAQAIEAFSRRYVEIRYGPGGDLEGLREALKRLRRRSP